MSLYWVLFANLGVIGMLVYNVCFKLSGASANAFAFTFILGCTQIIVLAAGFAVAKYGFKVDVIGELKPRGALFAILAGFSVVLIDMSVFLAFRYGSAMLTNTYCSVAGIIAFTALSAICFGEALSWTKCAGIVLGVGSLILVTL